jgi:uncharacterized repeat protein (TIGR03809 family)
MDMAQQWRSLAERRREHLLVLYRSGRWRRYYSEEQMMVQMRDLVRSINAWSEIGGDRDPPPDAEAAAAGAKTTAPLYRR